MLSKTLYALLNTGISGKVILKKNPLSNTALTTHIPELKARGITVEHDEIPADIIKIITNILVY